MILLLVAAAVAAPPDFKVRGEAHGCELYLGPTESDGVVPMYAECAWPDRSFAAIARVLDSPTIQGRFSQVAGIEVLASDGARTRVWQQHALRMLPDREVVIDWVRESAPDGAVWRWSSVAADLPRNPDNVVCARWEGSWRVSRQAGGVRVVFMNVYDTGGYPSWLVRPFLTSKLGDAVLDLKRVSAAAR